METPNQDNWVAGQLASLTPDIAWTPPAEPAFHRLRMRQRAARRNRSLAAWSGVGMLAAGATLLTYPSTRAYAHRCVEACVSETTRLTQMFFPAARTNARQLAPDFTLADSSGRPLQLSQLRGQVVLLNFWATWCNPCRIEVPWFIGLQRAYKDRGFTAIGISLDEQGWEPVRKFIADRGVNYPVALAGDALAQSYGGVEQLPTTLLIDKHGRIAFVHTGLVSKSTYEHGIRTLLAEP